MFTLETEREIANNLSTAAFGGPVTLTAFAYKELLTAARLYNSIYSTGGGYQPIGNFDPVNPPPRKP